MTPLLPLAPRQVDMVQHMGQILELEQQYHEQALAIVRQKMEGLARTRCFGRPLLRAIITMTCSEHKRLVQKR